MSSILQLSAMSRMSHTTTEIHFTFRRIQFIIMTSAAKHVHVIEAPQSVRIRSSVMSSLKFPARSSSLLPRENVVQHAVSLFEDKGKEDVARAKWLERWSRVRAVQIRSLARFLCCALAQNPWGQNVFLSQGVPLFRGINLFPARENLWNPQQRGCIWNQTRLARKVLLATQVKRDLVMFYFRVHVCISSDLLRGLLLGKF